MIFLKRINTAIAAWILLSAAPVMAESYVQQWKNGLSGSKLTSYSGSLVYSNTSTSSVVSFCSNGRYSYYNEGNWTLPGQGGGASNSQIHGTWDIQQQGNEIFLTYLTDNGEAGAFPIYLQNNRVNIGGTEFAVEQGKAEC